MILCIDSQLFIWGIKKQCTPGQEHMIERSEYFFKWADENKHNILIPTVVIAEVLSPEPKEKYSEYMNTISDNFLIGTFDANCAIIYANLLHGRFNDLKQFMHENGIRKEKMKADYMILSTAISYSSNSIYSNDSHLNTYSKGIIPVCDVPNIPEKQMDLFG